MIRSEPHIISTSTSNIDFMMMQAPDFIGALMRHRIEELKQATHQSHSCNVQHHKQSESWDVSYTCIQAFSQLLMSLNKTKAHTSPWAQKKLAAQSSVALQTTIFPSLILSMLFQKSDDDVQTAHNQRWRGTLMQTQNISMYQYIYRSSQRKVIPISPQAIVPVMTTRM